MEQLKRREEERKVLYFLGQWLGDQEYKYQIREKE